MSASNTSYPPASCDPISFTESTNNALLATIATKNADTDKPIFSNYTAVDSLTRNTNNPLHNLEGITGIIAWNDRKYGKPKGTQLGGYAVTPRHIVSARHAAYLKGDKVWFVARDNTLIERTVIAHRSPLYRSVLYTQGDYVIGLLDKDLPASIEPLEVLPPDFYKYLDNTEFNDTTWKAKDVFFVHTNQKEQSLFSKLNNIIFKVFEDPDPLTYNPANAGYFQRARQSKNAISEWSGPVIGGDSGSPSMFIVGTKLVPFSVWSTAMVGNFFGQARNYNDLNRLIVDTDAKAGISTGYTLTNIDMSEFKVYSQPVPNSKPSSPSVATCNVSSPSSVVTCNTSSPSVVTCNVSCASSTVTCSTPSSYSAASNFSLSYIGNDVSNGTAIQFRGISQGLNGNLYMIPYAASDVVQHDPSNDSQVAFSVTQFDHSSNKYVGSVLAPNGKIYTGAHGVTSPLIIDTSQSPPVLSEIPNVGSYDMQVRGPAIEGDTVYIPSYSNGRHWRHFDTTTDTQLLPVIGWDDPPRTDAIYTTRPNWETEVGGIKYDSNFGAVAGGNGKIYGIPFGASRINILDTSDNSTSWGLDELTGNAPTSNDTFNINPMLYKATWFNKYRSGVLASNGCIYSHGALARSILKIDTSDDSATEIPYPQTIIDEMTNGDDTSYLTPHAASFSSVLGNDGKVYSVPWGIPYIIWIDPADDSINYVNIHSTLSASGSTRFPPGQSDTRSSGNWYTFGTAVDNSIYYSSGGADKMLKLTLNNVFDKPSVTPTHYSASSPSTKHKPVLNSTPSICSTVNSSPSSSPSIVACSTQSPTVIGCPVPTPSIVCSPSPSPSVAICSSPSTCCIINSSPSANNCNITCICAEEVPVVIIPTPSPSTVVSNTSTCCSQHKHSIHLLDDVWSKFLRMFSRMFKK